MAICGEEKCCINVVKAGVISRDVTHTVASGLSHRRVLEQERARVERR